MHVISSTCLALILIVSGQIFSVVNGAAGANPRGNRGGPSASSGAGVTNPSSGSASAAGTSSSSAGSSASSSAAGSPTSTTSSTSTPSLCPNASVSGGTTVYQGTATYYTFYNTAPGSCGSTPASGSYIVALPPGYMPPYPSNCNKCVSVTYGNTTISNVTVTDRCADCDSCHIDLSDAAFSALANKSLGKINVSWSISNC